jgi:general secretion pathway protein E
MNESISDALLARATELGRTTQTPRLLVLESLLETNSDALLDAIARQTGRPRLPLNALRQHTADFSVLPFEECVRQTCVLVRDNSRNPVFVSQDPFDISLDTWASSRIPGFFSLAFAHPSELGAYLRLLQDEQQGLEQLATIDSSSDQRATGEQISLESIAADASQVVRFVNSTLYDAFRLGASDIHFENAAAGLLVRYRIDGVLGEARKLEHATLAEQVISRLKVMAELDIGERRIPQDGRITVSIDSKSVDFRVSIMPGLFGEDAVLRILDRHAHTRDAQALSLSALGFDESTAQQVRTLASLPYGMLLITGPTGSGKTTTLYATLSELDHSQDKIVTIEDPVEYQLSGVLQIPVNEKKGLTFARGLRSILRHDPDRILVGEIRDRETAEIAVQAALTGHLVYTTVHANNVFDVISRFRHMQIDTYSLVTALNGVVAQRLVRQRCPHCAPAEIDVVNGCAECRGTGYKGRFALTEILILNDALREALLRQASLTELKNIARQNGLRLMREVAEAAVQAGRTTTREINRVTFAEDQSHG